LSPADKIETATLTAPKSKTDSKPTQRPEQPASREKENRNFESDDTQFGRTALQIKGLLKIEALNNSRSAGSSRSERFVPQIFLKTR
jgi:hypothetical protein